MSRITHIVLDDANLPPPTPEIEQERKVAMFDLLEANVFSIPSREDRPIPQGPYHLGLSIRDKRLVFDVNTENAEKAAEFHLSLGPFRQVVNPISKQSRNLPPPRLKPSIWPGVGSTMKDRGFFRNGWKVKLKSIRTRRDGCSP